MTGRPSQIRLDSMAVSIFVDIYNANRETAMLSQLDP